MVSYGSWQMRAQLRYVGKFCVNTCDGYVMIVGAFLADI